MITVHLTVSPYKETYDADKSVIEDDGSLTLLKMETIAGYKCPLRLMTVAKLAPGVWSGVNYRDKE